MSTKVFGAYSDELESFSSLEYLVSPLQESATGFGEPDSSGSEMRVRGEFNNCLQKLTNLVYLLARDTTHEQDKQTALVLIQSEVAHLAVLARRAGITSGRGQTELEVTQ